MSTVSITSSSVLSSLRNQFVELDSPAHWSIGNVDSLSGFRQFIDIHPQNRWARIDPFGSLFSDDGLSKRLLENGYTLEVGENYRESYRMFFPGANSPKPGKLVGKWAHEMRQALLPLWHCRPFDRLTATYSRYVESVFDGSFEARMMAGVIKNPAQKALLHFSDRWPSRSGIYGDPDACYYKASSYNKYSYCPAAISDNGGLVVRAMKPEAREYLAGLGSGRVNDETIAANGWAIGRAFVMPIENYNGIACLNAYAVKGFGWFGKDTIAKAVLGAIPDGSGWSSHRVDEGDCTGWYINGGSGFVVTDDEEPTDFNLDEAAKTGCPCHHCGDDFELEDMTMVGDVYVCESCLTDNYYHCESCEEWADSDDMCTVHDFSDGATREICECCLDSSDVVAVPSWMRCETSGRYSDTVYFLDMGR